MGYDNDRHAVRASMAACWEMLFSLFLGARFRRRCDALVTALLAAVAASWVHRLPRVEATLLAIASLLSVALFRLIPAPAATHRGPESVSAFFGEIVDTFRRREVILAPLISMAPAATFSG